MITEKLLGQEMKFCMAEVSVLDRVGLPAVRVGKAMHVMDLSSLAWQRSRRWTLMGCRLSG